MVDANGRDAALLLDMRNRLIHGYGEVRLDLVWAVAQERLAPLVSALEAILAETESDALPE